MMKVCICVAKIIIKYENCKECNKYVVLIKFKKQGVTHISK